MSARAKSKALSSNNLKSIKKDGLADFIADDGLAIFASRAEDTRGRLYPELPSKTRGVFERDRDRVIHSTAFRRLKFKSQVFVYDEGDHYRSRLSHSIEVAQVARALARHLHLNEDLAETCALAHDLGHPAFAHVGEDALNACMKSYGGFDSNDQTLRLVTMLEKKYPEFDGLNLSWESLEGLAKHSGRVIDKSNKKPKLELTLQSLNSEMDLMLDKHASLEAQVAGLADDIAYNSHDLDDGFAAGFFTLQDLSKIDWIAAIIHAKRKEYTGIADKILLQETIREVMGTYVLDVLAETKNRIADLRPAYADDIRHAKYITVAMSPLMQKRDKELRKFLWQHFYFHSDVVRVRVKVTKVIEDLFKIFMDHPRCLPIEWRVKLEVTPKGFKEKTWQARCVADYIASMTDRLALLEHKDLFDAYQVMR